MKKKIKIILIPVFVLFIISACSKSEDFPEPEPTPTPLVTLNSITPENAKKGTEITLNGKNFGTDKSNVKVFFNEIEASILSLTDTQITTIAPTNGSSGAIKIIKNEVTVEGPLFTYILPDISAIEPANGPKGTIVTINGTDFGTDKSLVSVFFNNKPALIQSLIDTEIKAIVPTGASTGSVKILVDDEELIGPEFRYDFTANVSTLAGGNNIFSSTLRGITVDSSGNLYVADAGNFRIKKITPNGTVSTLAGNGTTGIDDGVGTFATFIGVEQLAIDSLDNIYVSDAGSGLLRKINTGNGVVTTIYKSAYVSNAIAIDNSNNIYFHLFSSLNKISPDETISLFAGSGFGFADGTSNNAKFAELTSLIIDASGTIFGTDSGNQRIRKITADGVVSTIAGSTAGFTDGTGISAHFNSPSGITVDSQGNLYVVDSNNHSIRKITPDGIVSTIAGSTEGMANGEGATAQFKNPVAITIDTNGNLYVTDSGNGRVCKITLD